MLHGPGKSRTRSGRHAACDLVESRCQATVARQGQTSEVKRALVDLLDERNFAVQEATVAEHAVDLRHRPSGIYDVLEYGGGNDAVEHCVPERKIVRVAIDVNIDTHCDIGSDNPDIGSERAFDVPALRTRSDDQHPCVCRELLGQTLQTAAEAEIHRDWQHRTAPRARAAAHTRHAARRKQSISGADQHWLAENNRVPLGACQADERGPGIFELRRGALGTTERDIGCG
jgi:hypothetical protein